MTEAEIIHHLAELLNDDAPNVTPRLVRASVDIEGLDDGEYLAGLFRGMREAMDGATPATVWTEHPGDGLVIFCAQTIGGSQDAR